MKLPLILVLSLGAVFGAFSVSAQTPTPAPGSVYSNTSAKEADRIADARAVIASGDDPAAATAATYVLDSLLLMYPRIWAGEIQTISEALIASNGQFAVGGADTTDLNRASLFLNAVRTKTRLGFTTPEARETFVLSVIAGLPDTTPDGVYNGLQDLYLGLEGQRVALYTKQGKYDDALAIALKPELLNSAHYCAPSINAVVAIKTFQHASDLMAWLKMSYLVNPYSQNEKTETTIASGIRAISDIASQNDFIASQTDATKVNPLAADSLKVPAIFQTGSLPEPAYAPLNIFLRGDKLGGLKAARTQYDSAQNNADLNKAVEGLAAMTRNFDGNLLRANPLVQRLLNKQGFADLMPELQ